MPTFWLRYMDAYTHEAELMRFRETAFNQINLHEVSRTLQRYDSAIFEVTKFNATLKVLQPTVVEMGIVESGIYDGNTEYTLCQVDLSSASSVGTSVAELVDLSRKHDWKRLFDFVRDIGFLELGREYKFGLALSSLPQTASKLRIRALNSFDVCGFNEQLVESEGPSGSFGGWTVYKRRNITTTAYCIPSIAPRLNYFQH